MYFQEETMRCGEPVRSDIDMCVDKSKKISVSLVATDKTCFDKTQTLFYDVQSVFGSTTTDYSHAGLGWIPRNWNGRMIINNENLEVTKRK